jgi:hypothetical protein
MVKRVRGGIATEMLAPIAICVAMLLAGCRGPNADAQFGPNPGGGYFGADLNSGTVNPSKIYDGI